MTSRAAGNRAVPAAIAKCPTGIDGFDEITGGGLPRGRTSLVCGGPGCGKTLFGIEFIVRGIVAYDEPGVIIAFEETADDLAHNVASLGFDLPALSAQGKLAVDHVRVERSEIAETGQYTLDGLFVRLQLAIQTVGAKRVVIDTLEALFGGLDDYGILRAELRRLFRWLKDMGVTALVTAERSSGGLTRHGLEEYVSDCVILLDHRVSEQVTTRRLRIVKFRGSTHGTNEYPFLIGESGMQVLPITSAGLAHRVSSERIGTGIARLDTMLGGHGYFRGSTILVSGTAGTGKTSVASHFVDACASRGERCVMFLFEESPDQLKRNMSSIGIDLARHEREGRLTLVASRPTMHGLEAHLVQMHKTVDRLAPSVVVVDPLGNLISAANQDETHLMAVRLIDFLKGRGITTVLTSQTSGGTAEQATETAISSIVDTWLLIRSVESSGERNRVLYVLKSRGMAHSNQVREFVMGESGIDLVDVYLGQQGVLTGSARIQQQAREREEHALRTQENERRRREATQRRAALVQRIEGLQAELAAVDAETGFAVAEEQEADERMRLQRETMAQQRHADNSDHQPPGNDSDTPLSKRPS